MKKKPPEETPEHAPASAIPRQESTGSLRKYKRTEPRAGYAAV